MRTAIDVEALPRLKSSWLLGGEIRVAVLRSKWHGDIVQGMYSACARVLKSKGVAPTEHTLPGCFEFPYAAAELCRAKKPPAAIICLGVVLKGETRHFEMILDECVRGLGSVSRLWRTPVINEILPVTDLDQARARAADDEFNKGIEAAAAAIEVLGWRHSLRGDDYPTPPYDEDSDLRP